jgi:hypothetical protein
MIGKPARVMYTMAEDIERAKGLTKPKRLKDKKLMKSYHLDETCLLCSATATPAHIKGQGAGGHDTADNIAPLCGIHHTEQGACGMTTFSERYPKFAEWLKSNGWELNTFLNKWRKA